MTDDPTELGLAERIGHTASPEERALDLAYSAAGMGQTDRPDLDQVLVAATALNAASVTMIEFARELARDPMATVTMFEDLHETIADALATALDAIHPDALTDDHAQMRGALARFLEGWAP